MPVEIIAHASNLSKFLYVISRDREIDKMFSVSFKHWIYVHSGYDAPLLFTDFRLPFLFTFFILFFNQKPHAFLFFFFFKDWTKREGKNNWNNFPWKNCQAITFNRSVSRLDEVPDWNNSVHEKSVNRTQILFQSFYGFAPQTNNNDSAPFGCGTDLFD